MKKLSMFIFSLVLVATAVGAEQQGLDFKIYNAGGHSFHVNSTLVTGQNEAAVIDAGFTKADALRIVANVLDSGKTLTTIFVSQADPDYYFGVETLKQFFPEARVLATPAVRKIIKKKMAAKVAYWGPIMGGNAPVKPVLPEAYYESSFSVDGIKINILGNEGTLAHRPYLWVPSEKAIIGNVAIFSGVHTWVADSQSQKELNAWLAQLAEMKALDPKLVVPGHMSSMSMLDKNSIQYTETYLTAFIKAKQSSANSAELIEYMNKSYPNAGLQVALSIGAKVHMGEMKW